MIILTESLLDSTWEKPGQPSNHCYVWSTCELIIEVLKCKVSLLRITNMPLTPWDLRFFRKTKSCFLSSTFFFLFFCNCALRTQSYLTRTWKPFSLTQETWRINLCLFILTMLVLVSSYYSLTIVTKELTTHILETIILSSPPIMRKLLLS